MKHQDAIFSREEKSPDGALNSCYNYQEGEKSPMIIEPCVTVAATGEVLFDFWRSRLNGHLDDFGPNEFRLTVSDSLCRTTILVSVDWNSRSFTIKGEPTAPRALSALTETLGGIVTRVQQTRTAASSVAPIGREPVFSRVARWWSR